MDKNGLEKRQMIRKQIESCSYRHPLHVSRMQKPGNHGTKPITNGHPTAEAKQTTQKKLLVKNNATTIHERPKYLTYNRYEQERFDRKPPEFLGYKINTHGSFLRRSHKVKKTQHRPTPLPKNPMTQRMPASWPMSMNYLLPQQIGAMHYPLPQQTSSYWMPAPPLPLSPPPPELPQPLPPPLPPVLPLTMPPQMTYPGMPPVTYGLWPFPLYVIDPNN